MKINLSAEADKNTFISWLVCELTAEDGMFEKCFGSYTGNDHGKITNAEIKLTINRVELNAKPALEQLYKTFKEVCGVIGRRHAENLLGDAVTLKLNQHWPRENGS